MDNKSIIVTIVVAVISVFASSGFWAFMIERYKQKQNKDDDIKKEIEAVKKMAVGLGHDRIYSLCNEYLKRGDITADEFENLHDYLYLPYEGCDGNGTGKKLMDDVKKLPLK